MTVMWAVKRVEKVSGGGEECPSEMVYGMVHWSVV